MAAVGGRRLCCVCLQITVMAESGEKARVGTGQCKFALSSLPTARGVWNSTPQM